MPGDTLVEEVGALAFTREDFATDLMWAAYTDDADEVRRIIDSPSDQLRMRMTRAVEIGRVINEGTALMIAAACGHREVVGLLVEHEGGIQDSNGKTALIAAAQNGHADCVELLLGQEITMQDRYGKTALMWAAQNGYPGCVTSLREGESGKMDKNGETALMWAAKNGRAGCVQLLLGEIGQQSRVGRTALMWAAYYNHADCVRHLMDEKGITTTGKCWNYPPPVTASDIAVKRKNQRIVDLLN